MQIHAARYPYPRHDIQDWTPLHKEYRRPPSKVRLGWPIIGFDVVPTDEYVRLNGNAR